MKTPPKETSSENLRECHDGFQWDWYGTYILLIYNEFFVDFDGFNYIVGNIPVPGGSYRYHDATMAG